METILSLPLEKKVGQLFFIGIPGTAFGTPARELIETVAPGGVCLFSRNIKSAAETRQLLEAITGASVAPPLLSLDQEGGLVDRLRRIAVPMPAAASIRNEADAGELARITGELLGLLGFNMNFAPVVDVISEDRARTQNGLFSRAFGSDAAEASRLSLAYLAGLQDSGITGCIKHFPGLGATEVDSHEELPRVGLGLEELERIDLAPYRTHFAAGLVRAVMVGHAAFPACGLQELDADGKLLPSSLSFNFVTALLRDSLGFKGVTITDDLEMGAILRNYGIAEASKMAVRAGADMLAICNDPERIREAHRALLDAVRTGEIPESRIDESLRRIGTLKERIGPMPDFDASAIDLISERVRSLKSRLSSEVAR